MEPCALQQDPEPCVSMAFLTPCYYSEGVIYHKPLLSLPPGQIQEVSLSQEEPAPQVDVTPELDLEVVPESSGDWQNVFSWPQHPECRKGLDGLLSADRVEDFGPPKVLIQSGSKVKDEDVPCC